MTHDHLQNFIRSQSIINTWRGWQALCCNASHKLPSLNYSIIFITWPTWLKLIYLMHNTKRWFVEYIAPSPFGYVGGGPMMSGGTTCTKNMIKAQTQTSGLYLWNSRTIIDVNFKGIFPEAQVYLINSAHNNLNFLGLHT